MTKIRERRVQNETGGEFTPELFSETSSVV